MRSRSKYEIDTKTIVKIFEKAGIEGAENIKPLGEGEFNSVYSIDAGGMAYALKAAPNDKSKTLSYEKDMLRQEVYYYSLMRKAGIRVPEIYFVDFTKSLIPTEYFIMERLKGRQLDKAGLSEEEWKKANEKLCSMTAAMHSIRGEKFGYRQCGLHNTWYDALCAMAESLISDCESLKHRTKNGHKLFEYIKKHKDVLEKAECSLINFDIWPANIFVLGEKSEMNLAWIDPERCLWGDRIADFVCLDFMNMTLDKKKATIDAYNKASDNPIITDDNARIRFAVMLGYLGLIMDVEKHARYSLFHFGYWRNVLVCRMIYKASFGVLKE